jgi:hypothetical protein
MGPSRSLRTFSANTSMLNGLVRENGIRSTALGRKRSAISQKVAGQLSAGSWHRHTT